MTKYNIVAATTESTVVSEYIPEPYKAGNYQSEASLENAFIKQLTQQGYEYLTISF
jgi:type I restriction enzyme, R subunit